jgi:hypothetical protein
MQSESKTRLALGILGVAALMGFAADVLLRDTVWGINLTLWIGLLIGGLFAAKRGGGGSLEFGSAMLMAPMIVFAVCFAWRDSSMLRGLDIAAIVLAAALVITRQTASFWAPSITRILGSVFNLAAHCFAGFVHLISRDIDWSQQRSSIVAANARSAAAGVLIAAPALIVFTILFVRADASFERILTGLMQVNIAHHLIPIAIGAWISGSYLRGVLVPSSPASNAPSVSKLQLGATEINVALALINVLFAAFVAVQTKYFFGNAQTVEITPGLTFSSYARRGFFELVVVTLLVLPILLAADRVHSVERSKRAFRMQSLILVGLVFCVMASALHRMRLYQIEYGLTELRFYTVAFMFFLAAIFALFCATVLRGWGGLFAMSSVGLAFAAIIALHVANPDQWIAKANLANARAGRRFDASYLATLSADAVPLVLKNSEVIEASQLERFVAHHKQRFAESNDWRSWNRGRQLAAKALANGN